MALTKERKAERIEWLAGELKDSSSAIIGTFSKLTVSQDFELRRKVREAGGRYRVVKNKLASRAAQGTQVEAALQNLKGVTSVAYTSGDPVALAKALAAWVKENAEFTFKLGIVDGKVITVDEVQELATMPGKDEIFAKLLFLINAPAQRLATVMAATGRDLAVVVNQAVEQNKFGSSEALGADSPTAETPKQAEAASTESATEAPAQVESDSTEAPTTELPKQAESASTEAPVEGQ